MITVEWFDDTETVLLWQFEALWDFEDYKKALTQSVASMRSKPYMVDVIVDMSIAQTIPNIIEVARYGFQHAPSNQGLTVLIVQSRIWLGLYNIVSTIFEPARQDFKFVRDVESACRVIVEHHQPSNLSV